MNYSKRLLLRTKDLFIKELYLDSDITIICFTPWISDIPRTEYNNKGFGEGLFLSQGYNELHIMARNNHWYQVEDVTIFLKEYYHKHKSKTFFTYGSSMGGFAAVAFAPLLNAITISVSPQFSISRDAVDFEKRWSKEASQIDFIYNIGLSKTSKGLLICDSASDDMKHANLILKSRPKFEVWKRAFLGHPAGVAINDLVGMKNLVLGYIDGTWDFDSLNKNYDSMRYDYKWYWNNLSYQLIQSQRYYFSENVYNKLLEANERFSDLYYLNLLVKKMVKKSNC